MDITPNEEFPILRIVEMRFDADNRQAFMALFERNKEAIESMPGCGGVMLVESIDANGLIISTLSTWSSQSDLDAYRNSSLFGRVWPATKALFSSPASAKSYSRIL